MTATGILLAAGSGERLTSDGPKAFVSLLGTPIVRRAAEGMCSAECVDRLVVAAPPGYEDRVNEMLNGMSKPVRVVPGGPTRQASAAAALALCAGAHVVVVHDAARALCPPRLFDQCVRELDDVEAVCVGLPVTDTIKEVSGDAVSETLDRSRLVAVQTPQAFRAEVYRRAHALAETDSTDDASLVERIGVKVRVIPGDPMNIKITTPHDLVVAEAMLGRDG